MSMQYAVQFSSTLCFSHTRANCRTRRGWQASGLSPFWKDQFWKRHRRDEWDWQSRGFHHRLRSDESWEEKWNYMRQNPVRAGLVAAVEDWPWQGVVHDLGLVSLDGI